MGFVSWIIIGAIVGWLSGVLTGRADRVGCLSSVVVAVVGTVVGGLLGWLIFGSGLSEFAMRPTVVGIVLAIILLGAGNSLIGPVESSESA
ncbi:MAG: GlsB/YeaQ/YmgE family stress response membrane protein [Chloroflexota bacterium]